MRYQVYIELKDNMERALFTQDGLRRRISELILKEIPGVKIEGILVLRPFPDTLGVKTQK